jgi:hypothetical protein
MIDEGDVSLIVRLGEWQQVTVQECGGGMGMRGGRAATVCKCRVPCG